MYSLRRNGDISDTGTYADVHSTSGQAKFPFKQNWLEGSPETSSKFVPQSKVRRALSESWKAVDESKLSAEAREAVQQLETGRRQDWRTRRTKVNPVNLTLKDQKALELWKRRQEQRV